METIGKVLSLTLLTIFGSAAATVYLIDSDVLPSYLDKPAVYTSDTQTQNTPAESRRVAVYRERERTTYAESSEVIDEPGEMSDVKPIWGQGYETDRHSSPHGTEERAIELARTSSVNSIVENIDYWNNQYRKAVRAGKKESADKAFRNYSEYSRALAIKESSDQ